MHFAGGWRPAGSENLIAEACSANTTNRAIKRSGKAKTFRVLLHLTGAFKAAIGTVGEEKVVNVVDVNVHDVKAWKETVGVVYRGNGVSPKL